MLNSLPSNVRVIEMTGKDKKKQAIQIPHYSILLFNY
jgi:hypothetical protein